MNNSHAIEVPAATLAALRQRGVTRAHIDALCTGTGPLNATDSQFLKDALQLQREQHRNAEAQILKIAARLARQ